MAFVWKPDRNDVHRGVTARLALRDGRPQCRASVAEGRGFIHQCTKPAHVQDGDGIWWCKIHDPAAEKARADASRARWKADHDRITAIHAKRQDDARMAADYPRLIAALQAIADGHNDPRALAAETLGTAIQSAA